MRSSKSQLRRSHRYLRPFGRPFPPWVALVVWRERYYSPRLSRIRTFMGVPLIQEPALQAGQLLPDGHLEVAALKELLTLCHDGQRGLRHGTVSGDDLKRLLSRIELRSIFLLRRLPISTQELTALDLRLRDLRLFLEPNPRL